MGMRYALRSRCFRHEDNILRAVLCCLFRGWTWSTAEIGGNVERDERMGWAAPGFYLRDHRASLRRARLVSVCFLKMIIGFTSCALRS